MKDLLYIAHSLHKSYGLKQEFQVLFKSTKCSYQTKNILIVVKALFTFDLLDLITSSTQKCCFNFEIGIFSYDYPKI